MERTLFIPGHYRVDVALVAILSIHWLDDCGGCFTCSWQSPQPLNLIPSSQRPSSPRQLLVADAIMEELREATRYCIVCGRSNHHCRAVLPVTCCNVREVTVTGRRDGCRSLVAMQLKRAILFSSLAVRSDARAAFSQGISSSHDLRVAGGLSCALGGPRRVT